MVVLSLGLHLLIVVLFAGGLFPHAPRKREPLYFVDLTNLPVKNPQAGRPDAVPPEKTKKPAPKPAMQPEPPPKVETVKPQLLPPKPMPKAPVKAEPSPAVKTPPKKAPPRPAETQPRPQENYGNALDAIDKLRREKEIADLKKQLAALSTSDSRQAAPSETPLGMATGKGSEAGPDEQEWIRKYLKERWNLSKYQVSRRDLLAETTIIWDAQGQLIDYKIIKSSGNPTFDESVRKAILKAKQLPFRPERRLEVPAQFNLKDLLE